MTIVEVIGAVGFAGHGTTVVMTSSTQVVMYLVSVRVTVPEV